MTDGHTGRLESALAGRYRVQRKLGEGGMASVYLAQDIKHERDVALKILKPELAAVIGAERFLTEIKTTANLQHPHILPLHDSGDADGFLFYVMPYIEGDTLRERLQKEHQLPVDEALRIVRDVADALDYAHRRGVIHRDIKPANILLHEGRPLVADFGIALAVTEAGGGRLTETGLSMGTPHYMSPEQASGERSIDARTDVYALGCVLYEMLAGQPPFPGGSAQSVLARILTTDPVPVTTSRRTVPTHIDSVLAKALEKLPADRFGSVQELSDALADEAFQHTVRQSGAHGTVPVDVLSTPRAPAPRGRTWAAAAVVGVVALAGGWALGAMGGGQAGAAHAIRSSMDLPDVRMVLPDEVVVSSDGTRFATAAWSQGGIYVRRADESEFRLLPNTDEGRSPTFSPDGLWLAYTTNEDDGLFKVSVDGGNPLRLIPEGSDTDRPSYPHWGDSGFIIFNDGGRPHTVPETGGTPTPVGPESLGDGQFVISRFLPGGRGILGSPFTGEAVWLFDVEADSVRLIINGGGDAAYVPTGHLVYGHQQGGLYAVAFDLQRMEVTGTPTPLLDGVQGGAFSRFSVSDNGVLVHGTGRGLTSRAFANRLLIVDLAGGVDTLPLEPRAMSRAVFSPDGGKIAFEWTLDPGPNATSSIYWYDLELGGPTQLTFNGLRDMEPVWSPDGSRIAFARADESARGAPARIFVKDFGGTETATPLLEVEGQNYPTDWTADGTITFETSSRAGDLYTMPADGGEPTPYLEAEWSESGLAVAPDGQWAAYVSDERIREGFGGEIFVRRFPEATAQARVSDGPGYSPQWSPDGRTLYYLTQGQPDQVIAARVQLEPSFLVLERAVVWEGQAFGLDAHPSEDKLLVIELLPGGSDAEEIETRFYVVVNWFEELRARLGEGN